MASDGLNKRAKKGKCRICQRQRLTDQYVKPVGEVHHGFATGHIWECIDVVDCHTYAQNKYLNNQTNCVDKARIKLAIEQGNFRTYKIYR